MITLLVSTYLLIGSIWTAECLVVTYKKGIVFPDVGFVVRTISFAIIATTWPVFIAYAAFVLYRRKMRKARSSNTDEFIEGISECSESVLSDIRNYREEFEADIKTKRDEESESK